MLGIVSSCATVRSSYHKVLTLTAKKLDQRDYKNSDKTVTLSLRHAVFTTVDFKK